LLLGDDSLVRSRRARFGIAIRISETLASNLSNLRLKARVLIVNGGDRLANSSLGTGGLVALDAGVAGADFVESVSDLHLTLALLHFVLEFRHLVTLLLSFLFTEFTFETRESLFLSLILVLVFIIVAPGLIVALGTLLALVVFV
jgi:hypothetical protein